jgi:hypothetical protein
MANAGRKSVFFSWLELVLALGLDHNAITRNQESPTSMLLKTEVMLTTTNEEPVLGMDRLYWQRFQAHISPNVPCMIDRIRSKRESLTAVRTPQT